MSNNLKIMISVGGDVTFCGVFSYKSDRPLAHIPSSILNGGQYTGTLLFSPQQRCIPSHDTLFLVSGHGLACQSEISLVLAKTLPIHYETIDGYHVQQF